MKGFFRGVGRVIDILRVWVGRFLFVVIVGFLLFLLFSGPAKVRVPDQAALVIAPTGMIVEQRTPPGFGDTLLGPAALQHTVLRDLIDALDRGAEDERINSLVLHLDDMAGISPANLETLDAALQRFRDSGKPVYAWGSWYSQGQYALAAHADEILMHPMGNLILQGYGGNQLFFSELLDNLHINVHIFRVGEFKAASEPYTRMDLSEEARADNQQLVDALWERFVARLAALRNTDESTILRYALELPALVDNAGGDMGQVALESGMVDRLVSREQFRSEMITRTGEQNGTFRQIHFKDYLSATDRSQAPTNSQIAVLVAEGTIMSGDQPRGVIGEESTVALIRQARADDRIRALVLRVNTPGGDMLASESIRTELSLLQAQGKPVVVSMGGVAASGGYWISATADEIWASPVTITGSIGVIGMVPTFEGSLAAIGVASDGIGTTPLSRGADPFGGLSDEVKAIFQRNTEDSYRRFISLVAEGRGMSPDEVEALAQGRTLTGTQAYETGLVDGLGDLSDAVASAAELADLDQWQLVYLRRPMSFAEQLLEQAMGSMESRPAIYNALAARTAPGFVALQQLPAWRQVSDLLLPVMNQSSRLQQLLLCEFCLALPDLNL